MWSFSPQSVLLSYTKFKQISEAQFWTYKVFMGKMASSTLKTPFWTYVYRQFFIVLHTERTLEVKLYYRNTLYSRSQQIFWVCAERVWRKPDLDRLILSQIAASQTTLNLCYCLGSSNPKFKLPTLSCLLWWKKLCTDAYVILSCSRVFPKLRAPGVQILKLCNEGN